MHQSYLGPAVTGGPAMLGMTAAPASAGGGTALPPTDYVFGDHAARPWSPDSPMFWLIAFTVLAAAGMAGAQAQVRLFRGRAKASVGAP